MGPAGRCLLIALLLGLLATPAAAAKASPTPDDDGVPADARFAPQLPTLPPGEPLAQPPSPTPPAVTRDLSQAQVAFRVFVYLEPRRDLFRLEVLVHAINMGVTTWLPEGIALTLPAGHTAFSATPSSSLTCSVLEGGTVLLGGSVPSGQHETSFSFQVPNPDESTVRFDFGLMPRVAQARVLVESSRQLRLVVDGFDPATPTRSPDGRPLLISERVAGPNQPAMTSLSIRLSGLPVSGPGRYVALLFSLGLITTALLVAIRAPRSSRAQRTATATDAREARDVLLDELVSLHTARSSGQIGPQAYSTARSSLLDALARLELAHPSRSPTTRSTPRSPSL